MVPRTIHGVIFSCRIITEKIIVAMGFKYTYWLVLTLPNMEQEWYQITKHPAQAITPKKSRFNRLSGIRISSMDTSNPNIGRLSVIKKSPHAKIRFVFWMEVCPNALTFFNTTLYIAHIMAATIVRISPFGDRCICWPLKLMKKIPIKATMKPTTKLILKGSSLKHK